jgi:hypothetical protein
MGRPLVPPHRRRAPGRFGGFAIALAVTALGLGSAAPVGAQTLADLLASLRQGGGWVSVPIEDGEGVVSSVAVPTAGLTLTGCVQVWGGHSGRWDIEARDVLGEGHLEAEALPGEPVPFTYKAGLRSQLEAKFRWSEPRDTTLLLWVGLARPGQDQRESCEPTTG